MGIVARLLPIAVAVAVAASLTGCGATAPVGHAELKLLGTWIGTLDGEGDGVVELVVASAAADGSAFDGDVTFAASGDEDTEAIHAELTPHGHLVAGVGERASMEAHIVDAATLAYCFIRYGSDPVYSCGRLVRQD